MKWTNIGTVAATDLVNVVGFVIRILTLFQSISYEERNNVQSVKSRLIFKSVVDMCVISAT